MEKENAAVEFFRKIHLTVFNRDYFVDNVLHSFLKPTLSFFLTLFALSLVISAIARTVTVSQKAPTMLSSLTGELSFQDHALVSPDTLRQVEQWRIRELSSLVTGVINIPNETQIFLLSIGGDSIPNKATPFIHLGKSAFSTNVASFLSGNEIQTLEWSRILQNPNMKTDAEFYRAALAQPATAATLFFVQVFVLSGRMGFGVVQIWIALLVYMIFFGRKLNAPAKFRLLLLASTPYFIFALISIFAADGVWFATDLALVAALIITVRGLNKVDLIKDTKEKRP